MNRWLIALKFVGIGWYISLSILGGVLLGRWLDAKLDTGPLLLIIGLFLGLFTAFYGAYRMIIGPKS
ncbi:AtpZ/AtpI family protein [Dehalogenimonas sp. THU2]|uniref:AtpZ/AtpI family protein n=1 Tax=Dehalogenimonas sp. THU2 TaxID=3151121 RepID=UPI00321858FE